MWVLRRNPRLPCLQGSGGRLWAQPVQTWGPRGPLGIGGVDTGCFEAAPLKTGFSSRLVQGPSSWLQESRSSTGQSLID